MKAQIALPSDGCSIQIEVEPLTVLIISLVDGPARRELQQYTQARGVQWVGQCECEQYLLMPPGTLQQRMENECSEWEEMYLIHLPGGGVLEHRCILHPAIAPEHPEAESWRVSRVSLFHPV